VSILDLFMAGLGFDIAGALLLARGLLSSPAEIAELNTLEGLESGATVAQVRDRVDAEFGVGSLILGFTLQAIGYVATVLGASSSPDVGLGSAAIALAFLLVAGGSVWFIWHRVARRRVRKMLPAVALAHPAGGDPPGWTATRLDRLVSFGRAQNLPKLTDEESHGDYVHRVFGVDVHAPIQ
jgi:hypothetical protein